jgi:hypothetical protein
LFILFSFSAAQRNGQSAGSIQKILSYAGPVLNARTLQVRRCVPWFDAFAAVSCCSIACCVIDACFVFTFSQCCSLPGVALFPPFPCHASSIRVSLCCS